MRRPYRVLLLVTLATAFLLAGQTAASAGHGFDLDCGDFQYQQDAQAHMNAHPGDPDRLDGLPQDGLACESLPDRPFTSPPPAPPLRISVAPATITAGQSSRVCVRTLPNEQVNVYAYTLPNRVYRLVRTGAAANTLPCWDVRPGADTRLYAAPAAGPASRNSASIVIKVLARTASYVAPFRTAVRQLPVAPENNAGFDRDRYFGDWIDADRDCQSTRHEVLIAESQVAPTYSSRRCTVTAGQWRSFYDGRTYILPTQLQIDHMVPVAEAWGSGGRGWTQARRVAFYNDLGVGYALNAMPSALNQSKQARGPEEWMPPVNRCRYVEIWTSIKHRWRLNVDPKEQAALIRFADACPNNLLSVPRA